VPGNTGAWRRVAGTTTIGNDSPIRLSGSARPVLAVKGRQPSRVVVASQPLLFAVCVHSVQMEGRGSEPILPLVWCGDTKTRDHRVTGREGRDSNPRTRYNPVNRLAGGPIRPLWHLPVVRSSVVWERGRVGRRGRDSNPRGLHPAVFKTAALNRSATSPREVLTPSPVRRGLSIELSVATPQLGTAEGTRTVKPPAAGPDQVEAGDQSRLGRRGTGGGRPVPRLCHRVADSARESRSWCVARPARTR
jgi:hypothetical protein